MSREMSKEDMQNMIAKRAAKELEGPAVVNLGVGIPTLVANYIESGDIFLHTENGLLGVGAYDENNIDPNLVNAGKTPVTEQLGSAYFDSAESFAMIRGGHVDAVILGVLQIDEKGIIANWSVPGKNIIGVGGAMDLLAGAKKIIVTMTHTSKDGSSKILRELTYPLTSTRSVDVIITELAVFKVIDKKLHLIELMPGVTLDEVYNKTEAEFILKL